MGCQAGRWKGYRNNIQVAEVCVEWCRWFGYGLLQQISQGNNDPVLQMQLELLEYNGHIRRHRETLRFHRLGEREYQFYLSELMNYSLKLATWLKTL